MKIKMMPLIATILASLAIYYSCTNSYGQGNQSRRTEEYCVVRFPNFRSAVPNTVDYGLTFVSNTTKTDLQNIVKGGTNNSMFSSVADVLNFMNQYGWELVTAVQHTYPQDVNNTTEFVMKRKIR